jgi:hypothetical protein
VRADGRAARAGTVALLFVVALSMGACAPCAPPDVDATVAQWQSTLSTGLPIGAEAAAVDGFLRSHRLTPVHSPADRMTRAIAPVYPADSRSQCELVSSSVEIACRFDAAGKLTGCTARAVHTGP